MATELEIFADITCPFTHVGLRRVVSLLADRRVAIRVRAWPLELVNGEPLDGEVVAHKAEVLRTQLGVDAFNGIDTSTWPRTTIPALELAAAATAVDLDLGLRFNLAVRDALFEEGRDISDSAVLAELAAAFGIEPPAPGADAAVQADYTEGQRRGVRGSPDFWIGREEFFCPALTIGHDEHGLTAAFDEDGLATFLSRIDATG